MTRTPLLAAALLAGAALLPATAQNVPVLDTLAIDVRGASREFAYTNKESAFLYWETGGPNRSGWQGFNVLGQELLDDYLLLLDGRPLRREEALVTRVFPDHLRREYAGGIVEQIRPADSLAAFSIIVTSRRPAPLTFIPLMTDGRSAADYRVDAAGGRLGIGRRRTPLRIVFHSEGARASADTADRGAQFGPGRLDRPPGTTHIIACAAAADPGDASRIARLVGSDPAKYFRLRRTRMERLLRLTGVVTDDARFNRALAWAKLSLDALIMNQGAKGIFAGLPWFNNYWGRDTFIALPGAALVTGHFREALAILRSSMAVQQTDPRSREYGRIPNFIGPADTAYNTVDGTPRFVIVAADYVRRSGDTAFVREVYPVVRRATDAALERHTDSLGFLRHADAETWMDAVGPEGPWSPRGDRANDIQALWAGQLDAAAWMALRLGDTASAGRWSQARRRLAANFEGRYLTPAGMADRLLPDGTPDTRVRPNQIFTLPLLSDTARRSVVRTVVRDLTYEYGVASLSQTDDRFHPWHQQEVFYPKDAAYHNGTVWTWVQGPVISALCDYQEQETAFLITANSVTQILDQDAVGTQSELLDALPRPGAFRPAASGTFSQAWNLAEFVRNFYDDYLGARVERTAHTLTLRPRLPRSLGRVRAVLNLDGRGVPVDIGRTEEGLVIDINGRELRTGGTAEVVLPSSPERETLVRFAVPPGASVRITEAAGRPVVTVNGRGVPAEVRSREMLRIAGDLALARPRRPDGLPTLRGPGYPLLPHAEVIRVPGPGARIMADAEDPAQDDRGVTSSGEPAGTYEYPRTTHLRPGSLDLTRCTVTADSGGVRFSLRFRSLSDPGWHPEYGFQLTYAAIAIDTDGTPGTGERDIGWNSGFRLPEGKGYEILILVGGGVRIIDGQGRTVAGYIPTRESSIPTFGDVRTGTVSFTIPGSLIGDPRPGWRLTVLAGAQDDHGGAGIGEFRTVSVGPAGEWSGGGKKSDDEPNVYDILHVVLKPEE